MFRRFVALLLMGCMLTNATLAFASDAPRLLARSSGGVSINRSGDENPVMEVAKSAMWGALAGLVVGSAIALAAKDDTGESIRWGIVVGTFAGLGAGIYFVAHRPEPASMLELRDGKLVPNAAALTAIEPVPGGARVHALAVRF
jgi:hypothetical protein